jgi:hypothetical protein
MGRASQRLYITATEIWRQYKRMFASVAQHSQSVGTFNTEKTLCGASGINIFPGVQSDRCLLKFLPTASVFMTTYVWCKLPVTSHYWPENGNYIFYVTYNADINELLRRQTRYSYNYNVYSA